MEHHNTIVTEPSFLNNYKFFKNIHIANTPGQKVVKLMAEDRQYEPVNWKQVVERFENSESTQIQSWSESVKNFCERYETIIRDFETAESSGLSSDALKSYQEMTNKTAKLSQNLFNNYPCIEMKSQLKNGQIRLTEMLYSEKFVNELGYSLESFASTVFEEGLPKMLPFDNQCGSMAAKFRLDKYLTIDKEGAQSEDVETCLIMKSGYMKKIKVRINYNCSYDKGVLNFHVFITIVARQRPFIDSANFGDIKVSSDFVKAMSSKELEMTNFLSTYYGQTLEQRYTNLDKICKIKELKDFSDSESLF